MDNTQSIPVTLIYPNPNQPRQEFDEQKLKELSLSIAQYGVLEPIVVTPRPSSVIPAEAGIQRYMIIAGERRFRATLLAGLESIPARTIEADDALVEELALLENVQRQDLNIIEEAKGYKRLLDRGWSREELASKLGFSQPWRIDERTSLLNLSEEMQTKTILGFLGNSQAFEVSRLPQSRQPIVYAKIRSGDLGTYNKLRAFVDGLIAIDKQQNLFELQTLSPEETRAIDQAESLLRTTERLITLSSPEHLKKAPFHSSITPERIDAIIHHLMKLRKIVLTGDGLKKASEAA